MLYENNGDFVLTVVQQPINGRVSLGKEKDRKPLDPPPFVKLEVNRRRDPHQHILQSPWHFVVCTIVKAHPEDEEPSGNILVGNVVSSLHRLKDQQNGDAAYFIFGDLSVKTEGKFRLKFDLHHMRTEYAEHMSSVVSDIFEVHAAKSFPGLMESTYLTRSFSDQGVRLRIRKDSRSMSTRKRNETVAHYAAAQHEEHQSQNARSPHSQLPMRPSAGDDGSSHFGGQHSSHYGAQQGMMQQGVLKRKRAEDDHEAMQSYPQPQRSFSSGHGLQLQALQIPQSPAAAQGYRMMMQSPHTAPPGPYLGALGRLDTSNPGRQSGPSSTPNSAHVFQSPHGMRHSPITDFQFGMSTPVTMPYTSAPTSAAHLHAAHGMMPSPIMGHMSSESNPRVHAQHAGIPSASTSPSEANYTPSAPPQPYGQGHDGYSWPTLGGTSTQTQMANPRNMPVHAMNLNYQHPAQAPHSYDGSESVHSAYPSNHSTSTPGYNSGPSTATTAYQDNDRTSEPYPDNDKGNDSQPQ